MFRIGAAFDAALIDADAFAGAVAAYRALRFAVVLDQHGVVDVRAERALNGFQIWLVAVRGELDAVGEPRSHILHEVIGIPSRLGCQQTMRPSVCYRHPARSTSSSRQHPSAAAFAVRNVLLLAVNETPNFIALDALGFDVRTVRSWKASQAAPASARVLATVLMLTSTTREIDRMDDPSQSMERIWTRLAMWQLVHAASVACLTTNSKHYFHYGSMRISTTSTIIGAGMQ